MKTFAFLAFAAEVIRATGSVNVVDIGGMSPVNAPDLAQCPTSSPFSFVLKECDDGAINQLSVEETKMQSVNDVITKLNDDMFIYMARFTQEHFAFQEIYLPHDEVGLMAEALLSYIDPEQENDLDFLRSLINALAKVLFLAQEHAFFHEHGMPGYGMTEFGAG